ncbi:MAG TPA: hypothetical protein DHW34_01955 [Actinobacteria bacterium]|nr:hypothetical protein [Actinomycetota bacterium]
MGTGVVGVGSGVRGSGVTVGVTVGVEVGVGVGVGEGVRVGEGVTVGVGVGGGPGLVQMITWLIACGLVLFGNFGVPYPPGTGGSCHRKL